MLAPIHTVKSGSIKKELGLLDTPTHKGVDMELKLVEGGCFVELTVRKTQERVLVPYTDFSHMVPDGK